MTAHSAPSGTTAPTGTLWWPEASADGGSPDGSAHYGRIRPNGTVKARCGRVFTPARHAMTGDLLHWHQPVDDRHGCPTCLACADHGQQHRTTTCPGGGGKAAR